MDRIWKIKPHDEALIRSIERTANVSPVIAQILALRGITDPQAIAQFIKSPLQDLRDGNQLPGVQSAAREIWRAIGAGEKILVYGDYDADGMTATAILVRCIQLLGGDVSYFVPNRLDDGYGLNGDALSKIADDGARLVVTVDCGIASIEEAITAQSLGLKLIITDHHQASHQLPEALAIVHPGLPGSDYPFDGLCGAGVALKLAWALCQLACGATKVSEAQRQFLLMAMGLAAIGTVADVVPLVDENRLIVKHGLAFLKNEPTPGVLELMKLTGLDGKPDLSAEDIAFTLAPRLNAAGRLGQAQLGVELLTTSSQTRAAALAEYIHQLNESRDSLERRITKAANREIREKNWHEQPAIVLAQRDWHPGVIGIVAGRIAEKYYRPTVLIAIEDVVGKSSSGSARSACGVNLYKALEDCSDLLVSWGGHVDAAGLKIEDENIDPFREQLCQYVARHTQPQDLEYQLEIDAEVPLSHLTLQTVSEIENLAPFGQANRRPVFCSSDVRLLGQPKRIGGGERHLSFQVEQHSVRMRCVAFGHGESAERLAKDADSLDIAFQPMINEFRGWRSVELRLIDWRPSQVSAGVANA